MTALSLDQIIPLLQELDTHPIYTSVRSPQDLCIFMSHHVYAVWDYMSLVKYLQNRIAPVRFPWMPEGEPALRHFINQLVLREESDQSTGRHGEPIYRSHFELYLDAMREVGANADIPHEFLSKVRTDGIEQALESDLLPEPSRRFSQTTFCIIDEDRPHLAAAALALGRERIIPSMFQSFLRNMAIDAGQAPLFHLYLQRHIHLDETLHTGLPLRLLEVLCADDPARLEQAEAAAEESICARLRFWDGIHEAIQHADA